ncbi:hypothetical protein Tco_0156992 [Tanacetum coccineum]
MKATLTLSLCRAIRHLTKVKVLPNSGVREQGKTLRIVGALRTNTGGGEGDGVSNWTSSRVIGKRVRVMSIDAFSYVGGGGETLRGGDSIEDEEVSLVDGVLEGALGALEALEIEALVDAMDVDNG